MASKWVDEYPAVDYVAWEDYADLAEAEEGGMAESWSLFGEDAGDESGQGDAEWIDEGEEETGEEGEGEDYPVLPVEVADYDTRTLRYYCAELEALRREWALANSRAYQIHVEYLAAKAKMNLGDFLDTLFAGELASVGD